jgi:hypothetical protein
LTKRAFRKLANPGFTRKYKVMYVTFTYLNISAEKIKLCASQRRSLFQTGCLRQHHCRFYTRIEIESHLNPNTVPTDANPTYFFFLTVKVKVEFAL